MANPRVRQHIHHYHEDSGHHLEHAWQAEAWRDLDSDLASPMVRMGVQDYYVNEVTRLNSGELVIPHRWFTRCRTPGSEQQDLYGMAWKLDMDSGARGYVVREWDQVQFPVTSLLASLPHIAESFDIDGGYDPRKIIGMFKSRYIICYLNLYIIRRSKATQRRALSMDSHKLGHWLTQPLAYQSKKSPCTHFCYVGIL